MTTFPNIRKKIFPSSFHQLIVASLLIGFLSAFLAITLKRITEHYETIFLGQAMEHPVYFFVFPFFGLSVVYFLRLYLFRRKENKGIKEIFESFSPEAKNLPIYKIPSHFINGFLTVIFGGSTGIEVSTVVASATLGSVAQQKEHSLYQYKNELICAGVAAGITALFGSPIAGILFAFEVISKKRTSTFFITTIVAVCMASGLIYVADEQPLFAIDVTIWHWYAIPYFLLLGILSGLHSVYLTRCVLLFKNQFSKISVHFHRILLGVALLGISLVLLPQLYGDGYHSINRILETANPFTLSFLFTVGGILLLKPIVTSATLAAGGDGGIFAPSLFIGAFLGLFTAVALNSAFGIGLLPVNFMILGMAAMLSASIHAPFTALFLVCGIVNDYTLFFPILAVCLISKYTAKLVYPYTVYSFQKA